MTKLKDEHINETTPGMPAIIHPTVITSFVAVDDKSCMYAVNCNQAAPDESKMFKMQSSLAGIDNVGNGTLNDSKMALFLSIKPDKDDEKADKKNGVALYSTLPEQKIRIDKHSTVTRANDSLSWVPEN
ncbi:hypothetical protein QTG54_016815 [Skeletonema marinoi]|uniref:Uncharacterized protein n=1 Tax=Skeletonema marinoi TaxID=267567 RepID=A0AAD8XS58_9STRA|nr:hypothetical protein QTG54_016815 [Skeletonema marinoi]